jgi:hypothetical protein
MVVELTEERRSFLTPARVLVGSLIGGAGIVLLGFFFGANSASAAEPAPSDPVAHSVLSSVGSLASEVDRAVAGTVGQAGDAVGAAARPVAAVVPAPVRHAVSAVAAPVTDAVRDVAAASPVTHVVTPVATAVDGLLNSIPDTHDLLGAGPVGTIVTPIAGIVDSTVGLVVGTGLGFVIAAGGVSAVLAGPSAARPALLGSSGVHPVTGWKGSAPWAPAAPGGAPPFDQPVISGSGASVSGSGAAGPGAAVPTDSFALSVAALGVLGTPADDRLPVSAVADHDTSPD